MEAPSVGDAQITGWITPGAHDRPSESPHPPGPQGLRGVRTLLCPTQRPTEPARLERHSNLRESRVPAGARPPSLPTRGAPSQLPTRQGSSES